MPTYNPTEFPENICWEVDQEFNTIRYELYKHHTTEMLEALEKMIVQQALYEAIREVSKRHGLSEKDIRGIYFQHEINHEEDQPTQRQH